jgi:hypothetical protein
MRRWSLDDISSHGAMPLNEGAIGTFVSARLQLERSFRACKGIDDTIVQFSDARAFDVISPFP